MVLYIDFEWETEPLKMALSKTLHCLKNVKTTRAPTVQCWSDSFLTQNYLEVVLYLGGTGVDRFWPRPHLSLAGARSEAPRQFLRWTFKFTSNEGEKKAKKKEETYRMKMTLPLFLQKNVFFHKNLSLLIIYVFFLLFFVWMQLVSFSHWFFFLFVYTPLPHRLTPPPPTLPPNKILLERTDPNEVTCIKKRTKTGEHQ